MPKAAGAEHDAAPHGEAGKRSDEARSRAQSGMDVKLELDLERGQAMEVAGFVGWLATLAALALYLAWAFTPDEQLRAMGIAYYPVRYLAVALPAWVVITFCCFVLTTTGLHLLATAAPASYDSLHDTASNELPDRTDWGTAATMGTPELADYPITLVTRTLHPVPQARLAVADRPRSPHGAHNDGVEVGARGAGADPRAEPDNDFAPTASVGPAVSPGGWGER